MSIERLTNEISWNPMASVHVVGSGCDDGSICVISKQKWLSLVAACNFWISDNVLYFCNIISRYEPHINCHVSTRQSLFSTQNYYLAFLGLRPHSSKQEETQKINKNKTGEHSKANGSLSDGFFVEPETSSFHCGEISSERPSLSC